MLHDTRLHAAIDAGHPEWAELPATHKAAKEAGSVHYFTGKPCKRGHVAARLTSDRNCSECQREYLKTPKYREFEREYNKTPKMREYFREYDRRRDASKRNATLSWLTPEHIAEMRATYAEAERLTRETGIPHHVDHIVPLTHPDVQGLHCPWNLQVLSASDNQSKNNSFDYTNENDSWRTSQ